MPKCFKCFNCEEEIRYDDDSNSLIYYEKQEPSPSHHIYLEAKGKLYLEEEF